LLLLVLPGLLRDMNETMAHGKLRLRKVTLLLPVLPRDHRIILLHFAWLKKKYFKKISLSSSKIIIISLHKALGSTPATRKRK